MAKDSTTSKINNPDPLTLIDEIDQLLAEGVTGVRQTHEQIKGLMQYMRKKYQPKPNEE